MWETVEEKTYDAWHSFEGDYTKAVATFETGPEQLTWFMTDPMGKWLADQIVGKSLEQGATPLYFRLLKDTKTSTWVTYWQVDFWASQNSPLAAGAAAWIITGALVALGIAYFSFRIVSEFQATKRAIIQKETEQARIDFINKYEPIYGSVVFDWLADVTKVPESVKVANPNLWDSLKKAVVPAGIGAGVIMVALIAFLLLMRR